MKNNQKLIKALKYRASHSSFIYLETSKFKFKYDWETGLRFAIKFGADGRSSYYPIYFCTPDIMLDLYPQFIKAVDEYDRALQKAEDSLQTLVKTAIYKGGLLQRIKGFKFWGKPKNT